MVFEVKGKVALVTGGVSGIGLSCAKELLKNGLKAVTLADIDENLGEKIASELNNEFGPNKVIYVKTDVTDKEQFENAFTVTVDNFKNLDIVINSAGICCDAKWNQELSINLTATVCGNILALNLLPKYRTDSEGVVVNISSLAGLQGFAASPVYSASKWGVLGASRSFGSPQHYSRTGVKVIAVCPSFTETPMIGKFGDLMAAQYLWPECEEIMLETMERFLLQGADVVGKAALEAIQKGDSASVWVVENGESYEIEFPFYRQLRKK